MTYKKHTITKTNTTTDINRPMPFGRLGTYKTTAYLYEIDGPLITKERGQYPFLTSIKQAKEFINDAIEADKERIAHDNYYEELHKRLDSYEDIWEKEREEEYRNWQPVTRTHHDPYGCRRS
jgi:hypothetical protein